MASDCGTSHLDVRRELVGGNGLNNAPKWCAACILTAAKGPAMARGRMKKLIEFYEVVSLNDADLKSAEKMALLEARLALRAFERAMARFKRASAGLPPLSKSWFTKAA